MCKLNDGRGSKLGKSYWRNNLPFLSLKVDQHGEVMYGEVIHGQCDNHPTKT